MYNRQYNVKMQISTESAFLLCTNNDDLDAKKKALFYTNFRLEEDIDSREYLSSSNCKDELNYARDLEKPRLLIYLEDVQLPSGMRMRLSRLQAIHKYKYDEQQQFYEKLSASQGIGSCLGSDCQKAVENMDTTYELTNPDALFRLICVLDTSGSMSGDRIRELNEAIIRVHSSLFKMFGSELAVDILQFDTYPRWKTLDDLPLEARGIANMGQALKALKEYGKDIPENCSCAVVFTSDGWATDLYEDILKLLQQEKWFCKAVKTGMAITSDADEKMLASIVGSPCAVVSVADSHLLPELFESISVASIKAAQKNSVHRTSIEGRNIIDWLDNENADEELKWKLKENGTLEIEAGAIIPDFYRPHPQTPWAVYRDSIRRVVLKQGIRIIGMHAFYDLPHLEEVVIPKSVTDIRAGAFGNCPKLRIVKLSRQVIEINAFKQKAHAPAQSVILWPEAFENTPWKNAID